MSAQKDDKPRWGDYPQKLELKYIKGLIENGEWFDGSRPFILVNSSSDRHFAPAYVLDNSQQFAYLLHTRKWKRNAAVFVNLYIILYNFILVTVCHGRKSSTKLSNN